MTVHSCPTTCWPNFHIRPYSAKHATGLHHDRTRSHQASGLPNHTDAAYKVIMKKGRPASIVPCTRCWSAVSGRGSNPAATHSSIHPWMPSFLQSRLFNLGAQFIFSKGFQTRSCFQGLLWWGSGPDNVRHEILKPDHPLIEIVRNFHARARTTKHETYIMSIFLIFSYSVNSWKFLKIIIFSQSCYRYNVDDLETELEFDT